MIRALFRLLVPSLIVSGIVMGVGYAAAQQIIRTSADEQPIQIAQDAAYGFAHDRSYSIVADHLEVDMDANLAPFAIVFDENGEILSTTGYLDRRTPIPPLAVFDRAREEGEYRFSWEPALGVQIAAVIVRFEGEKQGFVLAGKSLAETEARASDIALIFLIGWALLAFALLVFAIMLRPKTAE